MDRMALMGASFFSLLLALNGSLTTPQILARKGYHPRLGVLLGAFAGLGGGLLAAVVLLAIFPDRGGLAVLGSLLGGIAALVALWRTFPTRTVQTGALPEGRALKLNIAARNIRGAIIRGLLLFAVVAALLSLATLIWTIFDRTIGLTAVQYEVAPEALLLNGAPSGVGLDDLSETELGQVLAENARVNRLRVFILQNVVQAPDSRWAAISTQPVSEVLRRHEYPAELAEMAFNQLDAAQAAGILAANLERDTLHDLVFTEIVRPQVVQSWPLWESLTRRDAIEARVTEKYPTAELQWHSWLSWDFITRQLDPRQADATGLRPAIYGSLMIIVLTIVFAFPIGVGAAIYLEEYAGDTRLNRIIQTNIANLAGVPSIIYGMLGLAIFVRALEALTSGRVFGLDTANGRTVLSAGFTLALLILPLIIINAQEAIRAVPGSLRQASYGLGATQWQTIWNHVLPYAMPGILTGTILAISRAIGETAPLILVGGATYLTRDPEGPFSIFTAIPLLIYRWTMLPQAEFRNAAAAAIVVLLILLLSLNSLAIILRNRFSRSLS